MFFFSTKLNRIILGKLLGATALGYYQMAAHFGGELPTEFMHITNKVMMPAYAKIQDQQQLLKLAFLRMFEITLTVAGPLCIFIFFASPELVITFLGNNWEEVTTPLQILAAGAALSSVVGITGPLFHGTGYPDIQFWKHFIKAITTLILIYPLTLLFGISGTALATVSGAIASMPLFFYALKIAGISLRDMTKYCFPGFVLSVMAGFGVWPGKALSNVPLYSFLLQLLFSSSLMLIAVLILGRYELGPWILTKRCWRMIRTTAHR